MAIPFICSTSSSTISVSPLLNILVPKTRQFARDAKVPISYVYGINQGVIINSSEVNMRFSAVLLIFFLGFGATLIFHNQQAQAQFGGQPGAGQRQPGMGMPPGGGRGGQSARPAQPAATQPAQSPVTPRQQQQTGPLVQPFGEPSPPTAPAAGFGQRVGGAPQGSPGARNANAANAARQQREAQAAQQVAVQAARNANAVKQSGAYDHIPPAVRNNTTFSWFFEYDKDQDGQLSMMEYVNGRGGVWSEDIVREFKFLDRNGDGFATIDEALTSIREEDEKKAKEAREQQAAAGPQGGRSQPGQQSSAGGRRPQTGGQGGRPQGANPNQVRQPPSGRGQGNQPNLGVPSGRGRAGSQ